MVLVAKSKNRQVAGHGQIQICGGLEDAGGLRVVGQGDQRDRRVLVEEAQRGLVGSGGLPIGQRVEGELRAERARDWVLARVIRVWSRQEDGTPLARAGRRVHERAVGEDVAHAGTLVDANEGGL